MISASEYRVEKIDLFYLIFALNKIYKQNMSIAQKNLKKVVFVEDEDNYCNVEETNDEKHPLYAFLNLDYCSQYITNNHNKCNTCYSIKEVLQLLGSIYHSIINTKLNCKNKNDLIQNTLDHYIGNDFEIYDDEDNDDNFNDDDYTCV